MTRTEYEYKDAGGQVIGVITRIDEGAGAKTFRASTGFPKPRPLYNLDRLLDAVSGTPVLVVEGEKTADAATRIFPGYIVTTSPFGAKSANKADWSPIADRAVFIWRDNDEVGISYAEDVLRLVPGAHLVRINGEFPAGWDLADELPAGVTRADLVVMLESAEAVEVAPGAKVYEFPSSKSGKKSRKKNAKDDLKKSVEEASRERDALLAKIRALLSKTIENGCTEAETEASRNKAAEMMAEHGVNADELEFGVSDVEEDDLGSDVDGDALLESIRKFLERFVSYPSKHAAVAHTLWISHTHMMEIWDSTPRIAFMSPERGSGKTRALEATEFLVPRPVHSVNNSVAYVIRKVASDDGRPTILYDEVDALFGNKAPDKADLLALLNAGHRKGATSGRCIVADGKVRLEELPAYAALALAGLRDLPDTLASRSILIEMRRRAPDEKVEPFRERIHRRQAEPIFYELVAWCAYTSKRISGQYPEVPSEITDRDADCWEPLLAIADAAGGAWPELARDAAVFLVRRSKEVIQTKGVELLEHILEAFGDDDRLWTEKLLKHLHDRDESPWLDIRGHPLTDRGLAERLRHYGIKSKQVRIGDVNHRGYFAADFYGSWTRYLEPAWAERYKRYKRYIFDNETNFVADVADVAAGAGGTACRACDGNYGKGCPHCKPENHGLPPKKKAGQ